MKATFNTEDIEELTTGARSAGPLEQVRIEHVGEWRWGNICRLIFTDELGDFWSFEYRESSGDGDWNWPDNEDETVECTRVYPRLVTITTYTTEENN